MTACAAQQDMKSLRQDIDLFSGPRQEDGSPTWTLHDPVRGRFFTIGWLEFEFLRRWGMGSFKELVESINRETPLRASEQHAQALQNFLTTNELVQADDPESVNRFVQSRQAEATAWAKKMMHSYLFFRVPLIHPDKFLTRTLPYIRFIYTMRFAYILLALSILGLILVAKQWDAFIHTFSYAFTLEGLILFSITLFITKVFHELGHAYTAKYFGVRVPTMGVAFLVMWPVLFTDTSESWKLVSRRSRLAIGAAGMIAELGLAGLATLIWSFLPDGAIKSAVFFIAAISWVFTLAINFNPFMRWDGYYLMSDYLGVQNLQDRAFSYARWALREWLFDYGEPAPERFDRRKRKILLIYSYCTWVYRFILFMGIAVLVYHLFFKIGGLVLAAVEIYFFLLAPIVKEMKIWVSRRKNMRWNRSTVRTAGISLILLGIFLIPWTSHISAPGLQRSFSYMEIYSPAPARITQVNVENGQQVKKGSLLIKLESPGLERQLSDTKRRIRSLRLQLARQSTDIETLEGLKVVEQKLATALAEYQGQHALYQQLSLLAPFNGEIRDMPDALNRGRWVSDRLALGRIIDRSQNTLVAYLDEDSLIRIQKDSSGRFYPDNPSLPAKDVIIGQIDMTNSHEFYDRYNASVYGGPVAVSQQAGSQAMYAHQAIYRVQLLTTDSSESPNTVTRGTVRLEAESQSLLGRFWHMISAVLIRESGF
jgi:putative peptide zinc metalloprotease protein